MKNITVIKRRLDKKITRALLIGILFGAVLFVLIRFIFNSPAPVHYHANFAVFINSTREEFDGPGYYEEVQTCSATTSPRGRTHMHQPDNNIAHVHDKNVTWGHFFESIGWALGPNVLATKDAVYQDNDGKKLTFLLNGEDVPSPYNQVIGNEDALLVSYGDNSINLKKEAEAVARPVAAHQANTEKDPAACRGSEELGSSARLKKAIW